ncbi:MAG: hypothetical protein A2Z85_01005 [Chlamydiae bacterium GWA2_50_15]|nr:MAG: hypothetical protein A2Z85_01005 [Chlamydiae bacterium GWA2_50_15]OGN69472.1 MAG: hypothetical protein A3I15_05905 [Chlamydiae bacterium RIFCSPLOWO2_02_FULL_49_12]
MNHPFIFGLPLLIQPQFPNRMGFIPIDALSRTVTPQFLPLQAPHCLLLQIVQIEFIDQPPNMNTQLRVIVIGDDPIRNRDDLHLKEGELVD